MKLLGSSSVSQLVFSFLEPCGYFGGLVSCTEVQARGMSSQVPTRKNQGNPNLQLLCKVFMEQVSNDELRT